MKIVNKPKGTRTGGSAMPGIKPLIAISGEIWGVLKGSWDEKVFREVVFCFSQ